MAFTKGFGLAFPFRDDPEGAGGFLAVTSSIGATVRSNLHLLVTTRKGTRWLRPTYGCSQVHRVFDPNDQVTLDEIRLDIQQSVAEWLPGVSISAVTETREPRKLILHIFFEYSEGVLRRREVLDIAVA